MGKRISNKAIIRHLLREKIELELELDKIHDAFDKLEAAAQSQNEAAWKTPIATLSLDIDEFRKETLCTLLRVDSATQGVYARPPSRTLVEEGIRAGFKMAVEQLSSQRDTHG